MIRNEKEYKLACSKLEVEASRYKKYEEHLKKQDFTKEQIIKLMEPLVSFHLQLKEEIEDYEKLKRGEIDEFKNFKGLGRTLVALRIARGFTQKELAKKLDVDPSLVSRDEKNEYHGITIERAQKILEALKTNLVTSLAEPVVNKKARKKLVA